MPADEHLGEQFVGYHYADPVNRESIGKRGLMPRHPESESSLAEDDDGPAGVYMFHDKEQATVLGAGDVWKVTVPSSQVEPDPFHADKPGVASYTKRAVPPENIRLVHKEQD